MIADPPGNDSLKNSGEWKPDASPLRTVFKKDLTGGKAFVLRGYRNYRALFGPILFSFLLVLALIPKVEFSAWILIGAYLGSITLILWAFFDWQVVLSRPGELIVETRMPLVCLSRKRIPVENLLAARKTSTYVETNATLGGRRSRLANAVCIELSEGGVVEFADIDEAGADEIIAMIRSLSSRIDANDGPRN